MRKPKDYNNGKIYVIKNHKNELVYVGSTTQPLYKRFYKHKCSINSSPKHHYKLYQAIREIGLEYFYIELIEEYPCENKEQLLKREGHWIRELDSYNDGYNGRIAGRICKEYYDENKDRLLAMQREKYRENPSIILDRNKKYNKSDKAKQYYKKYQEENKNKLNQMKKEYYEKNRNNILEKVVCECGSEVCRGSLTRHLKSIKHLKQKDEVFNL